MSSGERLTTKIAVGVSIALIVGVITYFAPSVWPPVRNWLLGSARLIWQFLSGSHLTPGWLLVLLGLLAIIAIIMLLILFVALFHRPRPHWHNYCQITLFGVVWRWRYNSYDDSITDLTSFCARCDTQVYPQTDNYGKTKTNYHCDGDRCDHSITLDGSTEGIKDRVSREIQRRLRSGEWIKEISIKDS